MIGQEKLGGSAVAGQEPLGGSAVSIAGGARPARLTLDAAMES